MSWSMRAAILAVFLVLALSIAAWVAVSSAASLGPSLGSPADVQVIIPQGTVIHVTNFSALARFSVVAPGAQFVGALAMDHWMWIMAWTNGTPMPMCPIAEGYVGSPTNATYNESLKPATYTFSEVCGGLGNLTVTRAIELVYPGAASGGTGGGYAGNTTGVGGSGGGGPAAAPPAPTIMAPAIAAAAGASVTAVLGAAALRGRSRFRFPRRPPAR